LGCAGFAQQDSLTVEKVIKTNNEYTSFVTKDKQVFALTKKGRLVVWDLDKFDTLPYPSPPKNEFFTALAIDNNNEIFVGSHKGKLYSVNTESLTYSLLSKNKHYIHSICFNSENKLYVLNPNGVYEPIQKKYWNQFENKRNGLSYVIRVKGKEVKTKFYFVLPNFSYLDSKDRLWMYKSSGEWGYDLHIFDTRNEEIMSSDFMASIDDLYDIKSIFEDQSGALYILSSGFVSKIYKFINDSLVSSIHPPEPIIDTVVIVSHGKDEKGIFTITAELPPIAHYGYIRYGPAVFNESEKTVYFIMSDSIFTAHLSNQEFTHQPTALFEENLFMEDKGYTDNFWKFRTEQIDFNLDNKLVYLTRAFIGIYHDRKVILLK